MSDNNIVDVVLSESKILEDVLNKKLLETFVKIHNVDPKYSLLQLKQEVVANTSVFMNVKKKYGLHIINREGKQVDDLEIKGMVTRRSEYPEFTKKKVTELLNLLLLTDNVSFSEIDDFCKQTRIKALELIKAHDTSISGAVSFSKPLEDYKIVPGHVNAMLLWNTLEYEYFTNGTKGYLFRINGVNNISAPEKITKNIDKITLKNTSIAIPYEEEKLPEYYEIDVNTQISYVWDNRVQEILSCIKPKELSISNIFELSDDDFE